jgi:hypothetical protein
VIDAIVGREAPTQRHADLHARGFPEHHDAGFDCGHRSLSDAVADADDTAVHQSEPPILGHQDGRDDRERVFQRFRSAYIGTRSRGEQRFPVTGDRLRLRHGCFGGEGALSLT